MTIDLVKPAAARRSALSTLAAGIAARLAAFWRGRHARIEQARRRRVLEDLAGRPDWQLDDLGLNRSDLRAAVSDDEAATRLCDLAVLRTFFR